MYIRCEKSLSLSFALYRSNSEKTLQQRVLTMGNTHTNTRFLLFPLTASKFYSINLAIQMIFHIESSSIYNTQSEAISIEISSMQISYYHYSISCESGRITVKVNDFFFLNKKKFVSE